jgi:hypothetical protein
MKTIFYCLIILLISKSVKSQEYRFTEVIEEHDDGNTTFKIKFNDATNGLLVKDEKEEFYVENGRHSNNFEGPYNKDAAIVVLYKKLHPEIYTNHSTGAGVNGGVNPSGISNNGSSNSEVGYEEYYGGVNRIIMTAPDGSRYYLDSNGRRVYVYKNGVHTKKTDAEKRSREENLATQSSSGQRLKKDGTPDRRYKENRSSKTGSFGNKSSSKSSGRSGG